MATYQEPPLIEVFCEFFLPEDSWDEARLALFSNGLPEGYSSDRQRQTIKVEIKKNKKTGALASAVEPSPKETRHQFWAEQRQEDLVTVIQLGPGRLVVNQHGKPRYSGCDSYKPKLLEVLRLYREHWPAVQAKGAALHYIDQIYIEGGNLSLADWFYVFPHVPPTIDRVGNLQLRFGSPGVETGEAVVVSCRQMPEGAQNRFSFIWQWDYVRRSCLDLGDESVEKWLERSHARLLEVFESAFTDRLRNTWKPQEVEP